MSEDEFLPRFFAAVYEAGKVGGAPLPERPMLGLAYVFPNTALINNLGNSLSYRFRPDGDDPEASIWEIWSVSQAPADQVLDRPVRQSVAGGADLPPVFAQDASNMVLQQKGVRSAGFTESRLSLRYKPMIPNMHLCLDGYLRRSPTGGPLTRQ
jgi:hypothetical protein